MILWAEGVLYNIPDVVRILEHFSDPKSVNIWASNSLRQERRQRQGGEWEVTRKRRKKRNSDCQLPILGHWRRELWGEQHQWVISHLANKSKQRRWKKGFVLRRQRRPSATLISPSFVLHLQEEEDIKQLNVHLWINSWGWFSQQVI